MIASGPDAARALVIDMLRAGADQSLSFPDSNTAATELAAALGFRLTRGCTRMRLGPAVPGSARSGSSTCSASPSASAVRTGPAVGAASAGPRAGRPGGGLDRGAVPDQVLGALGAQLLLVAQRRHPGGPGEQPGQGPLAHSGAAARSASGRRSANLESIRSWTWWTGR